MLPSQYEGFVPPAALEDQLCFWLRLIAIRLSARLDRKLEELGFSEVEWITLRSLYEQSGTTQFALLQRLGMTKGEISKTITRLERRGLVQRQLAEGSSRIQWLSLTPLGDTLVPRLAAVADSNEVYFFCHLNSTEQALLKGMLQSLVLKHQRTFRDMR